MADLSVRLRILAESAQANADLRRMQDSLDRMRGSLARVGHYGTLAFAGWNIAGALPQLVSMADSVKLIDARLRLVTQSSAEFVAAQRLAYDVARETGTGFEAIAGLYTRLAMTGADYGLSAERIATVTRSTAQALKLSGASAAESAFDAFKQTDFQKLHDQHWQIEQYHRMIKQVCNIEKLQVRRKTPILNHIFAALCGYVHLQRMQFTEMIRNACQWQKALYQDVVASFITRFMGGKEYLNPQFQASVNA